MKKTFLTTIVFLLALLASAQDINSNYYRIYAGYLAANGDSSYGYKLEDKTSYEADGGFAFGFTIGMNIAKHRQPLFLELGLESAEYRVSDKQYLPINKFDVKTNSLKVPVGLAYKFPIKSTGLVFSPSLGMSLNYIYKAKVIDHFLDTNEQYTYSLFDKQQCYKAHHFMTSYNAGLSVIWKHIALGYRFEKDFTPLYKLYGAEYISEVSYKFTVHSNLIALGYTF